MSRGPRSDERPSGWWRRLCQQPWLVGARGPLDFTVSLGILMALSGPKWRNWQTRMIQGHVPARVWGFKSPLRHQLLTASRLHQVYLMRPTLRPSLGDFGGNLSTGEASEARHGAAEVFRGKVGIPHGHGEAAVPEQFLKLL